MLFLHKKDVHQQRIPVQSAQPASPHLEREALPAGGVAMHQSTGVLILFPEDGACAEGTIVGLAGL